MSEVLRDLVVSLSLDGDNFSRNLTSINKTDTGGGERIQARRLGRGQF